MHATLADPIDFSDIACTDAQLRRARRVFQIVPREILLGIVLHIVWLDGIPELILVEEVQGSLC